MNRKRYIKFLIVGAIGVIPNYIIYYLLRNFDFFIGKIIYVNIGWVLGIIAGATSNYILNEVWTFDR